MRTLSKVVFSIVLSANALHAQAGSDQQGGTNFKGTVRFANNQPAAFVRVELWSDGETTWRTFATTDRMGHFQTSAPCMVVQYRVELPGYRSVYGRKDISTHPCLGMEDITLRPLPGQEAKESAPEGLVDARIAAIPPEAKTEFDLGQSAIAADHFSDAIPHLEKAVSLYPRFAEAFQLLAVAQLRTNQGPQAEQSLIKAVGIDDRIPQAQYFLGVLYAMTNRPGLAEKPLNRFAELEPANPEAQFELAKVNFALSRFSTAEVHARKSIELKEPNPGVHIVLGYALLRQGKAREAQNAFETFLRLNPSSPMAADVKTTLAAIQQHAER
jgi:Flp pilus assembly protein TadD